MTTLEMTYRFIKLVESVHPSLVNGPDRPDTETILTHLNKAQNTLISQKYAKAGGFKMKSEAFNQFHDEFQAIIFGQNVTDLTPLLDSAHYGKLGTLPTGYMHYLRSDSSITKTDPADVVSYQIETITLTGADGTATISAAGSLTKTVTFTTSLAITAANFYVANVAAYAAVGIVLTNVGNTIVMTAAVNGVSFTAPIITNATLTLNGSVAHTFSTASYVPNQLGTYSDLTKIMTTAFNKPIFNNPIIILQKGSFWIVTDSYTTVNSVYFMYIKQPATMTISSTSELSEFLHEDIITIAVQDYISSKNIPREKTLNVNN